MTLTATSDGTIAWDQGVTNGVPFTADTSSTFTVTATSDRGCAVTDTVTVTVHPLPTLEAGEDTEACFGDQVTLAATSNGTIAWDQEVSDGIPFVPEVSREYHVTATSDRGCMVTDTVKVTVNPLPTLLTGEDVALCAGEQVTLLAVSDGSITWDQEVNNGVAFVPETSGEYHVTSTNDPGCTTTDTVSVTVHPLPEADAGPDMEICAGESVTLQASGGVSYAWENGLSNGDLFSPDKDTSLEVTVTSEYGCIATDVLIINLIQVDTSITQNGTLLIANANDASYQWFDCLTGEPIAGEESKSFTPQADGSYAVEITQNGCSATSPCHEVTGTISVRSELASNITCYPNPTSGLLKLDLGSMVDEVQIRISDLSGKLLLITTYHGNRIIDLDLESYDPGFYLVEAISPRIHGKMKVLKIN